MILFHEKDCIVQIPFGKRALCTKMATDETADKDRRAYKVPIPGNKSVVVTYGYPLLLGVTQMADGYNFAVEAEEDSEVYLLLYRKRGREPFYELLLDEKYRTGRIFSVFMKKLNVTNLEYNFKINGEIYTGSLCQQDQRKRAFWGSVGGRSTQGALRLLVRKWL